MHVERLCPSIFIICHNVKLQNVYYFPENDFLPIWLPYFFRPSPLRKHDQFLHDSVEILVELNSFIFIPVSLEFIVHYILYIE